MVTTSRPLLDTGARSALAERFGIEAAELVVSELAQLAEQRPELAVDIASLADFIAARLRPGNAHSQIAVLDLSGLQLAWACSTAQRGAYAVFERELGPTIRRALARLNFDDAGIDELQQTIRLKLFGPGRRKIDAYEGRGSLRNWVRAVAMREGLSARRRSPPGPDTVSGLEATSDPELGYLKQCYRQAFRDSLRTVMNDLDASHRLVLRLRFKDRLTLPQLATALGVHRATAARRLANAREAVWRNTRRELTARLGVDRREFESILRLVRSRWGLTLSNLWA